MGEKVRDNKNKTKRYEKPKNKLNNLTSYNVDLVVYTPKATRILYSVCSNCLMLFRASSICIETIKFKMLI